MKFVDDDDDDDDDRKSCELLTSASANLTDYTILGEFAIRFSAK